jgi:hypothetical protein
MHFRHLAVQYSTDATYNKTMKKSIEIDRVLYYHKDVHTIIAEEKLFKLIECLDMSVKIVVPMLCKMYIHALGMVLHTGISEVTRTISHGQADGSGRNAFFRRNMVPVKLTSIERYSGLEPEFLPESATKLYICI